MAHSRLFFPMLSGFHGPGLPYLPCIITSLSLPFGHLEALGTFTFRIASPTPTLPWSFDTTDVCHTCSCSLHASVLCTYKTETIFPPRTPRISFCGRDCTLQVFLRTESFRIFSGVPSIVCFSVPGVWNPVGSGNEKLDALFAGRAHGRAGAHLITGVSGRCHARQGCFPFPCRQKRKWFRLFLKRSALELCSTVGNIRPESSHFLFVHSQILSGIFFPPRLLFSRFYLLPRIWHNQRGCLALCVTAVWFCYKVFYFLK